jgi:serine/threonine protein kinase
MIGARISSYHVLEKIGSGAMGVVYRAQDTRLERQVALKFLPPHIASDPEVLARFQREARAASAINHPNICTVNDIGEHAGQPYLVMELLDGATLKSRISGRPIQVETLLAWAVQIGDALHAAHEKGIVHRDVKPANLFVTTRDQVKVLDFGVAKRVRMEPVTAAMNEATTLAADFKTQPDLTIGTISHMSPEQARGEEVDARSDVFSFGVVLYEMATGRLPFQGGTSAVIFDAILNRAPQPPLQLNPELPGRLGDIIERCLEKDRAVRYQSAADLVGDLQRVRRSLSSGSSLPAVPLHRRTRIPYRWVAAGLGLFIAAIAIYWISHRPPPRAPRLARLTANSSELAVSSGAISPSGRYLAYTDNRGVQIRHLGTQQLTTLLPERGYIVEHWLPDETAIVLRQQAGDAQDIVRQPHPTSDLWWSLSIVGNAQRRQHDLTYPSPDGKWVATWFRNGAISVLNVDGGLSRIVRKAGENEYVGIPTWSPDSARLLYWRARFDPGGGGCCENVLETVALDGSRPVQVYSSSSIRSLDCLWLPDGRIVFIEDAGDRTLNPHFSVYAVPVEADGQPVRPPQRVIGPEEGEAEFLTGTEAGDRIAYLRRYYQFDVTIAELSGDKSLRSHKRLTLDYRMDRPTAWTHDSRAVLFGSNRNGTLDIFRQNIDSMYAEAVVSGPDNEDVPRLSGDGAWIIYRVPPKVGAEDQRTRFYRAPSAGGPASFVAATAFASARCDWSGPCTLTESIGPHKVVFEFDPLKGKGREIFRVPIRSGGPARSPRGDWAYVGVSGQIELLNEIGTPVSTVPVGVALSSLDWASDSSGWFAASLDASTLYFIDLTGRKKAIYRQPTAPAMWAVASPDGTRLAILTARIEESNLWSIENF